MKRFVVVLSVVAAAVAVAGPTWDSSFTPIGTFASTNPTSANIAVPAGAYVKVQCDAAAYIGQGVGSGTTCTSTTCVQYQARESFYAQLQDKETYVAALAVAGTANCLALRSLQQ